jgi:hypothetical protein
MLYGDAYGFIDGVKAIAGRGCGDDRHGTFAIASVVGLQEIALFRLGGQAGGRAAALDIANEQGISRITARPIASALRAIPGPDVVVTPSEPP